MWLTTICCFVLSCFKWKGFERMWNWIKSWKSGKTPGVYLLEDMPLPALKMVLEHLDVKDFLNLRKVSPILQNFMNTHQPNINLDRISISLFTKTKINLTIRKGPNCYNIVYEQSENGCFISHGGPKKTFMAEENFIDALCKDLSVILKHQKSTLTRFAVVSYLTSEAEGAVSSLYSNLQNTFDAITKRLKIKDVHLEAFEQVQMTSLLPIIDPFQVDEVCLKGLSRDVELDVSQVCEQEIWTESKGMAIISHVSGGSENFIRFKNCNGLMELPMNQEDTVQFVERFLQTPNTKSLTLKVDKYQEDFLLSLGPSSKSCEHCQEWVIELTDSDRSLLLKWSMGSAVLEIKSVLTSEIKFCRDCAQ